MSVKPPEGQAHPKSLRVSALGILGGSGVLSKEWKGNGARFRYLFFSSSSLFSEAKAPGLGLVSLESRV